MTNLDRVIIVTTYDYDVSKAFREAYQTALARFEEIDEDAMFNFKLNLSSTSLEHYKFGENNFFEHKFKILLPTDKDF